MNISISALAKKHNILPQKSLGQNFIYDLSLCEKIAKCASINESDHIIEIGPGTAGLTRAILMNDPKKFIAIEKDKKCMNLLNEVKSYYPKLEIVNMDAMNLDLLDICKNLFKDTNKKVKIISNLPYNVGTSIIINFLKNIEYIHSMHFMVQKEVAVRICAKKDNKQYGRLSILSQLICDVEKEFDVSPDSFYPKPKVTSSIVSFFPKTTQIPNNIIEKTEEITKYAFNMRRKMLNSSLKPLHIEKFVHDIDLKLRAENLSPNDYLNLAKKILK